VLPPGQVPRTAAAGVRAGGGRRRHRHQRGRDPATLAACPRRHRMCSRELTVLGGGASGCRWSTRPLTTLRRSPRWCCTTFRPRLAAIRAVLAEMAAAHPGAPEWGGHRAGRGAGRRAVCVLPRSGWTAGRAHRWTSGWRWRTRARGRRPRGPGGIAYGLRSVPVALHVAAVADVRTGACYHTPAGMITEARQACAG